MTTMVEDAPRTKPVEARTEHFDVLIVGAGISGVGGAYHLQTQCPETSFVALEAQESFGGTWLTHRYPGIRSDSDLFTFGYRFKPWVGPPIATGEEIRKYMGEVIDENDLARHIRFGHRITGATWSSADSRWTVTARRGDAGQTVHFTAGFLWMCQGYFRHDEGYTPHWDGMESFKGQIVHPQTWPKDLDHKGKRVVIIGSGATAATVAPAIAGETAHVTVLQRSPTYYIPAPNVNELYDSLTELKIDPNWIHEIVRRRIVFDQDVFARRCVDESDTVTKELLDGIGAFLPPEEVAKNFTPSYRPWRQRVAFLPDGDMLASIRDGKASVVTDEIDRFTPEGILLKSGRTLETDIVVTATGFNLNVLGDIDIAIDGEPLVFSDSVTYRGMMFTGIPNMAWVFGYFRASWTLRTELIADFVCRLINHMKTKGVKKVEVALRPEDHNMPLGTWIDPENFNPGYLMRGMSLLPQRGDKREWQHTQDYWHEKDEFPTIDLDGKAFVYS